MNSTEEIASGAWARLRNLIAALDRVDRLETSTEFEGWLQELAGNEQALEGTIQEFLLHALEAACDPINFQILLQLKDRRAANIGDLIAATRLSRVEMVERINELSRAGLAVQALEGDQVEATNMVVGLLSFINEITVRMKALASNDHLLNPSASFSKLPGHHARNVNPSQEDSTRVKSES